MRIDGSGNVGIGTAPITGYSLVTGKNLTGATTVGNIRSTGTILSDVTVNAVMVDSIPYTQAASFVLANLQHYRAYQGTIGAGSSVTTQYGFNVDSILTGATNNYGFYGGIASGTGRYNLYMAGTAANYLAGDLSVGGVISGKISAGVYQDKVTAVAASTATTAIDLSLGNSFVITISANTTISFTNPPAGTDITSFTLITVNNATAGYAISWPASVTWAGGVTPARTTAANKSDVYTFFTRNAGTQYVGSLAVLNY